MTKKDDVQGETLEKKEEDKLDHCLLRIEERQAGSVEPEIVTVSVNGKRLTIKRNEIVPVHESYLEAFRHAVQPVVEKEDDNGVVMRRHKVNREASRFGVTLIRRITAAEAVHFKQILKTNGTITEKEAYGE